MGLPTYTNLTCTPSHCYWVSRNFCTMGLPTYTNLTCAPSHCYWVSRKRGKFLQYTLAGLALKSKFADIGPISDYLFARIKTNLNIRVQHIKFIKKYTTLKLTGSLAQKSKTPIIIILFDAGK